MKKRIFAAVLLVLIMLSACSNPSAEEKNAAQSESSAGEGLPAQNDEYIHFKVKSVLKTLNPFESKELYLQLSEQDFSPKEESFMWKNISGYSFIQKEKTDLKISPNIKNSKNEIVIDFIILTGSEAYIDSAVKMSDKPDSLICYDTFQTDYYYGYYFMHSDNADGEGQYHYIVHSELEVGMGGSLEFDYYFYSNRRIDHLPQQNLEELILLSNSFLY